jgi:hypothetical protein
MRTAIPKADETRDRLECSPRRIPHLSEKSRSCASGATRPGLPEGGCRFLKPFGVRLARPEKQGVCAKISGSSPVDHRRWWRIIALENSVKQRSHAPAEVARIRKNAVSDGLADLHGPSASRMPVVGLVEIASVPLEIPTGGLITAREAPK